MNFLLIDTIIMAPRGRPLSFDRNAALLTAMDLFQRHGYEGTSIADLTRAIGISAPSLYNAFGDKESLFKEAVEHYVAHDGGASLRALRQHPGSAREAVGAMLQAATGRSGCGEGRGCLVVLGAANCGEENQRMDDFLKSYRLATVETIHRRLVQAQADGELSAETDTRALACFYATVLNGIAIQVKDGAPSSVLAAVAEAAMRAWPEPVGRQPRRGSA